MVIDEVGRRSQHGRCRPVWVEALRASFRRQTAQVPPRDGVRPRRRPTLDPLARVTRRSHGHRHRHTCAQRGQAHRAHAVGVPPPAQRLGRSVPGGPGRVHGRHLRGCPQPCPGRPQGPRPALPEAGQRGGAQRSVPSVRRAAHRLRRRGLRHPPGGVRAAGRGRDPRRRGHRQPAASLCGPRGPPSRVPGADQPGVLCRGAAPLPAAVRRHAVRGQGVPPGGRARGPALPVRP